MNHDRQADARRGFALILVVTLLALLVLAIYALSVLVRVQTQVTTATGDRQQARQHALIALRMGLGELQRLAGPDARVTAMAGVSGIPEGGAQTTRHWCGVWSGEGVFLGWLASGAQSSSAAVLPGLATVALVGEGSVGKSVTDSEHVIAGVIPITVAETAGTPGNAATIGAYAYLVLDEGVKVSVRTPGEVLGAGGLRPVLAGEMTSSAQGRLRTAVEIYDARLVDASCYAQLAQLPLPSKALTPSTLQDNFHHVTLTALVVRDGALSSGVVNLNTSSVHVWRSILATYNAVPGVERWSEADMITEGRAIARGLANSASGKIAHAPFTSAAAFGASELLADHLPSPITPEEFMAAIAPALAVRSDTFRIRGYGEARNPQRDGEVEATAWCEAVVQRLPPVAPEGNERRFAITYFRWLGPEDG
ncbi:hypothetical protein [Opitutus terrae]|uniref:Uncharacterized protein n=1 Tax=Opitutus terrae (strain DSM 11246 / JCM 15787 / PB90-1) TaxID=452637 RepID=B1ZYA9_OPITP|nr:hypothetical protein [Opitutus terrae]ACB77007.1 hypothetical protein Oter_3732 [Opitutus terrae PB90-1]